jgi:hypothetical protein|tara:strand:+ start:802 stop:987 length:186 start_codon:yes stop_codon:yes gene_type:complete
VGLAVGFPDPDHFVLGVVGNQLGLDPTTVDIRPSAGLGMAGHLCDEKNGKAMENRADNKNS